MRFLQLILISILFATAHYATADARYSSSDLDLSGITEKAVTVPISKTISPDRIDKGSSVQGLNLQFVRLVKGNETALFNLSIPSLGLKTDQNGFIQSQTCSGTSVKVTLPLKTKYVAVGYNGTTYELSFDVQCGIAQKLIFEEKTNSGQIMGIWQVASRSEKKLSDNVDLRFWRDQIVFTFPDTGDFYDGMRVHISQGDEWDVVNHEMGHAIYDQAKIGESDGGSHKIDECYTKTLALSEGWASFFAAWVNLDLNDSDARFEYMVPRRAPLQIENVPSDVCGKTSNEWRVTSFLWDLIDLHSDGENSVRLFKDLWDATLNKRAFDIEEVKNILLRNGWDQGEMDFIWKLKFPAAERTD